MMCDGSIICCTCVAVHMLLSQLSLSIILQDWASVVI